MGAPQSNSETSSKILDVAERLVQVRGYNAFSYADIASALRVTKASLHYHFPSKAALGTRLMQRYTQGFLKALATIDRGSGSAAEKLDRYVAIYAGVLAKNRMCLCGMLAAEHATLPKPMQAAITRFFDTNETWLAAVLEQGRQQKRLQFPGPAIETARMLVAALEGAMMLARSYGDAKRFQRAADRLLATLRAANSCNVR